MFDLRVPPLLEMRRGPRVPLLLRRRVLLCEGMEFSKCCRVSGDRLCNRDFKESMSSAHDVCTSDSAAWGTGTGAGVRAGASGVGSGVSSVFAGAGASGVGSGVSSAFAVAGVAGAGSAASSAVKSTNTGGTKGVARNSISEFLFSSVGQS